MRAAIGEYAPREPVFWNYLPGWWIANLSGSASLWHDGAWHDHIRGIGLDGYVDGVWPTEAAALAFLDNLTTPSDPVWEAYDQEEDICDQK